MSTCDRFIIAISKELINIKKLNFNFQYSSISRYNPHKQKLFEGLKNFLKCKGDLRPKNLRTVVHKCLLRIWRKKKQRVSREKWSRHGNYFSK